MSDLIVEAIRRSMLGFPASYREPEPVMMFQLAMERAILGMPSSPRFGPPRMDYLLYRAPTTPNWMED